MRYVLVFPQFYLHKKKPGSRDEMAYIDCGTTHHLNSLLFTSQYRTVEKVSAFG